jgi:hypothetical protein
MAIAQIKEHSFPMKLPDAFEQQLLVNLQPS